MKSKAKRNIFITILVIVVAVVVVGYRIWNRPHRDVKAASAVKISAGELYKMFTADSSNARTKYQNNILEVMGEVKQISKNQQNQQVIYLKTQTADAAINCTMEESAENIRTGETVTLKGICSGYISGDAEMGLAGDVFLVRCYVSK
jgi:ABC-type protease/lipase transport system fused ATPase/permease subunit